jgi:hypothetical protein
MKGILHASDANLKVAPGSRPFRRSLKSRSRQMTDGTYQTNFEREYLNWNYD